MTMHVLGDVKQDGLFMHALHSTHSRHVIIRNFYWHADVTPRRQRLFTLAFRKHRLDETL